MWRLFRKITILVSGDEGREEGVIDNKNPTLKLIGIDVRQEDKQIG